MKRKEKLLTVLNRLLSHELTVISQYGVHSEACEKWEQDKLHNTLQKQARKEMLMRHAEWLIQRILFLDGVPVVSKLNPMKTGKNVLQMAGDGEEAESAAARAYNALIRLANRVEDQATSDLLTKILQMEEGPVDWAKQVRAQITRMGPKNSLPDHAKGTEG